MNDILVVEDYIPLHHLLNHYLSKQGFQVTIETNIRNAAANLQNTQYVLILLDLSLPDGNGVDFLRHVRQDLQLEIPIIVMSALKFHDKIHECLELGANDYLVKPVDISELLQRITHWTKENVAL